MLTPFADTDGVFETAFDRAESFGHDLESGTPYTPDEYRLLDPAGRAFLKYCPYVPPAEAVNEEYPLALTTGRSVYHFHTRSKTMRVKALQAAEPDAWVELSNEDAAKYGIAEGDLVRVTSRRGEIEIAARVGNIRQGQVFVPFHYGYYDSKTGRSRAFAELSFIRCAYTDCSGSANELTPNGWDLVSKQPFLKGGAVKVQKIPPGEEVPKLK